MTAANTTSTNPVPITSGQMFPYVRTLGVYRCPADKSMAFGTPRLRSVAISQAFHSTATPLGNYLHYRRMGEIRNPSGIWVLIDENPVTINDAALGVSMTLPGATSATLIDSPAGYHLNASGLSFADGHSEIRKWKSAAFCNATAANVTSSDQAFIEDAIWLTGVTSIPN